MEISLIRHGKSLHTEKKRMSSREFSLWVEHYDSMGVANDTTYPALTIKKMTNAPIVFSSDLARSIQSANLLKDIVTGPKSLITDPIFREAQLPFFHKHLFGLKLSPNLWTVTLRCLWLLGVSTECESYSEAKQRAVIAVDKLIRHANEHRAIVLVGHGIFNRMLAKQLQKQGWQRKNKMISKHWSCTTFQLE